MNGELSKDGDQWRLRFVRRLPHAPEKVWRALTEDTPPAGTSASTCWSTA
jgi:hypothetical protein